MIKDYSIDIVVPWVDDSDPKWRSEYIQYTADRNSDNSESRYRDWDLLKFWFRSIEQYAPWVRTIHFLTYGHLPKWLNVNHPKINVVLHKDFIPEKYLPTFSSHVIELNMFRIQDLSENFVYFNDDVYLTNLTRPEDFFMDGKPLDTAVFGVIKNSDNTNFMPYIMLNMMGIINMNFDKKTVTKNHFSKWFSLRYGKDILKNIYLYPWSLYTGFMNYHTCTSYCKSTFEKVWTINEEVLDRTCSHKFRSKEDVNQYLFRYWQLCEGQFVPKKSDSAYLTIGKQSVGYIERLLYHKKYKVLCINDDPEALNFEQEKENLQKILSKKFPNKSTFEL